MQKEELKKLQKELDVQKWNDAQTKGADTCGSYDYCAKCDKTAEYPCATAKTAETVKETAGKEEKAPAKKSPIARKPRVKKAK